MKDALTATTRQSVKQAHHKLTRLLGRDSSRSAARESAVGGPSRSTAPPRRSSAFPLP
ncbi:hypothetical protein MSS93_02975 [Deinococcus radiodurans]|nr:hypothetical protein MSS93_02975 [Deinococcus radiodurans]